MSSVIDRLADKILSSQDEIIVDETQQVVRFASSTDTKSFFNVNIPRLLSNMRRNTGTDPNGQSDPIGPY